MKASYCLSGDYYSRLNGDIRIRCVSKAVSSVKTETQSAGSLAMLLEVGTHQRARERALAHPQRRRRLLSNKFDKKVEPFAAQVAKWFKFKDVVLFVRNFRGLDLCNC